ncbi:MAG TPA: hypothetical protein VK140_04340 [Ktedonobacteraceae bacterium]|nr:hypothetical protein [Ktedonobacteraceae bacterium]
MVARVLFPLLTCGGTRSHPPAPGGYKGLPHINPTTLAPTASWARVLD